MNLRTHIIIYRGFLFRSFTNVFEKNLENEFFLFHFSGFFLFHFYDIKNLLNVATKNSKIIWIYNRKKFPKKTLLDQPPHVVFFQQNFAII
jgi:hypothetical protein